LRLEKTEKIHSFNYNKFPFPIGSFSILQSGKLSILEEGIVSILGKGKEKTLPLLASVENQWKNP